MKTDNELIAEFMGILFDESGQCTDLEQKYSWRPGVYDPLRIEHLQYNSSWHWLIPVVEKIENMIVQVEIHTAYTNINGEINGIKYNHDSCFEAQEETKLIVTYRAVLRFIKWYVKQKELTNVPPDKKL